MLAEQGRPAGAEIATRDTERRPDEVQVSPVRVLDGGEGAPGPQVRVGVEIAGVARRSGGDAGPQELARHPVAVPLSGPGADDRVEFRFVPLPGRCGREPRILGQLWPAHRGREPGELLVAVDLDG